MRASEDIWKSLTTFLKSKQLLGISLDDLLIKIAYGGILVLVIVWLLPSERPFEYSNLTVGSIAREEIIAPFDFPILKSETELKKDRRLADLNVPPVFNKNQGIANTQYIKLEGFFQDLQALFKKLPAGTGKTRSTDILSDDMADSLVRDLALKYNVQLDSRVVESLYQTYREGKLSRFYEILSRGLRSVYIQGILNRPEAEIQELKVVVTQDEIEEEVSLGEVFDLREAGAHIFKYLQSIYGSDVTSIEVGSKILSAFLVPDLIYDDVVTQQRKTKAVHDVPLTRGFVYKDQRIVDGHEIVTEEVYRKLQSLAAAQKERSAIRSGWEGFKFTSGKFLFALVILFITVIYLLFYRKNLFRDNRMLGMITLIFLLQFALIALILNGLGWSHWSVPVLMAPMLLAMLLDAGVAFICTVSLSLAIGGIQGNDYTMALMSMIVGSVALYSVLKIRNRGQMFRAILYVMLAYLVVNFTYGLLHFEPFQDILKRYAFYLLPNAILSPTAVFLLIGIFERLFDVTTDITLLELSDLNHPVLKRLSVEAPGTFHHSIIVGNLAEAGAKAIGANALLARVGCYYHDIGKMLKPEYFVENQMGAMSKHENLSPSMSCLILINHVKAGQELAEKYNLPKAVKQFIPEHHGTSLITFFYHKAKEIMDLKDINEPDFRYPGPKPQSKETAISMLADTVEAASRTLQNPTMQRVRSLIDTQVEKKIEERQLDECDLTLKELNLIKEAFIPILTGIHHFRIEYPAEAEKERTTKQEKLPLVPKENGGNTNPSQRSEKNRVADRKNHSNHADPDTSH